MGDALEQLVPEEVETIDVIHANRRGADLHRANLRTADLPGACCHNADHRGVHVSEARLGTARLRTRFKLSMDLGTEVRCP